MDHLHGVEHGPDAAPHRVDAAAGNTDRHSDDHAQEDGHAHEADGLDSGLPETFTQEAAGPYADAREYSDLDVAGQRADDEEGHRDPEPRDVLHNVPNKKLVQRREGPLDGAQQPTQLSGNPVEGLIHPLAERDEELVEDEVVNEPGVVERGTPVGLGEEAHMNTSRSKSSMRCSTRPISSMMWRGSRLPTRTPDSSQTAMGKPRPA